MRRAVMAIESFQCSLWGSLLLEALGVVTKRLNYVVHWYTLVLSTTDVVLPPRACAVRAPHCT